MKIRDVIKLLEDDGWYLVTTRGSHREYMHPTKPGRVTVPAKTGDDIAPGTLTGISEKHIETSRIEELRENYEIRNSD